jgi:hypothetical protein
MTVTPPLSRRGRLLRRLRWKAARAASRRPGVSRRIVLGRSFRSKSSKGMAFPHPKSRKDNYRKEEKPNSGGALLNFRRLTINVTEYRIAKDDVNPATNRMLVALLII